MKKIMAASALLMLLAVPALAQTNTAPREMAPEAGNTTKADGMFYTQRAEWRASKLVGARVTNGAKETIGNISEVLIDKNGKISAVVIGVGGFLGMGERNVAVSFDALRFSNDENGNPMVTVNASKEQLKTAPEWKWEVASVNQ